MRWILGILTVTVAACSVETTQVSPVPSDAPINSIGFASSADARRGFEQVVARVEPMAEALCRQYQPSGDCDFKIIVDKRRRAPPNAYQTVDKEGRPILTFTESLIAQTRNPDELAFVMGHEASHHIRNHLARQAEHAASGADAFAELAKKRGESAAAVESAKELGEFVGARTYSKEFELEADELGTVIALRAGFDPLVGAQFFTRIPDPADRFLSTHPPNAARYEIVAETVRRSGG